MEKHKLIWRNKEESDKKLLNDIEKERNLKFPERYKDLVINNCGTASFIFDDGYVADGGTYVDGFNRIVELKGFKKDNVLEWNKGWKEYLPDPEKMFIFGIDSGANPYIFDYRENENEPKIMFLRKGYLAIKENKYDAIVFAANTFDEFIDSIKINKNDWWATLSLKERARRDAESEKSTMYKWENYCDYKLEFDPLGYPIYRSEGRYAHLVPEGDIKINDLEEVKNLGGINNVTDYKLVEIASKEFCKNIEKAKPEGKTIDEYLIENYKFSDRDIERLKKGKTVLNNFVWHLHQEAGRVQLILRGTHITRDHLGGCSLWGEFSKYI